MLDERNAEIPDIHSYPVDSPLSIIVLTSDEVESVLKNLPVGKAVGPDGISNRVFKELSREISPALCGFLNQSLQTGIVQVSNGAKIRNRYNQVPHLTQDTNGKVTNSKKTPQTRAKRSALSQQVTLPRLF